MAEANSKPVTVVVGVGPGLGAALARRFAAGYTIAIVARRAEYLAGLAREIESGGGQAFAAAADVTAADQIASAFDKIRNSIGAPEVLLYNAAMRPGGRLMDTQPGAFEDAWRVTARGAFLCSQQVVPGMLAKRKGVILFTGATAGVKPFPTSAAFGPAEFALRGLAQVMARDLGPQGIHVAYINIDGGIDTARVREHFKVNDDDLLKPSAIADSYWHLAHQDRSAWTQELDLRPFKEKF